MKWEEKTEVKLGTHGELLVDRLLDKRGVIRYKPDGGPHPFDRLCVSKKGFVFIAETKTKPARRKYADTGIDERQFLRYRNLEKQWNNKIPIFLFFVDSDAKKIYGGSLHRLAGSSHKETDRRGIPIIYFRLSTMTTYADISDMDNAILKNNSQRHERYQQPNKHGQQMKIFNHL